MVYTDLPLRVLERFASLGDKGASDEIVARGPGAELRAGWDRMVARYGP